MTYLLVFVAVVVTFYCGILFGISNCKRHYGIPKGKTADQVSVHYVGDV